MTPIAAATLENEATQPDRLAKWHTLREIAGLR
jgi:hypothetical protein